MGRVSWRSRHERTRDSSIIGELINGAKGGTRTPTDRGPQDPESGDKPINNNRLQDRTTLNNKERGDLRAVQMALVCGVVLAIIAVC